MFITFEGLDGSGKSTQCVRISEALNKYGKDVLLTREPGGTELGESIRDLLLKSGGVEDPLTEYLLFTAARVEHVNKLIKPALNSGKVVVCDRFYHSSLVYQGVLKGLSFDCMHKIYNASLGDFKPDLTILLDISPEVALTRLSKRADSSNHYDDLKLQKLESMRAGYLAFAEGNERFVVIDAGEGEEVVFKEIFDKILKNLR